MSDDYDHKEYLEELRHERYIEALPMWRRNGFDADQRLYAVADGILDDWEAQEQESLEDFEKCWSVRDVQSYASIIEIYLDATEAEKILEACRKWIALVDDGEATGNLRYHTVEVPLTRGLIEEE